MRGLARTESSYSTEYVLGSSGSTVTPSATEAAVMSSISTHSSSESRRMVTLDHTEGADESPFTVESTLPRQVEGEGTGRFLPLRLVVARVRIERCGQR